MSSSHKSVQVMGLTVFNDDLSSIPIEGPCRSIATISPISYGTSTTCPQFRQALREADYLVLDGVYFALASLLLHGKPIRPNQGPDVFHHFMRRLDARGGRAFFLGSSQDTLDAIHAAAARQFPNVTVGSFSPPFKPSFDEADSRRMIEAANAFRPDIVFVGMTAPKQEKWVHQHHGRLSAGLAISIGAVFDWFAGKEKPIAPIWWKLRLAWLIRTVHRPEILNRYPKIGIFFWHLALTRIGVKRHFE